jgi:hypothetical protein
MDASSVALWLLVIGLGVQVGGGLYEIRVMVPLWSSSPPQSVLAFYAQPMRPDSGGRFWIFLTPLVGVISLVNFIVAWRSAVAFRAVWLFASGASLLVIAVTFAYFVPVLLRLPKAGERPGDIVEREVRTWVALNWIRVVVVVAAWVSALRAFSIAM